MWVRRGLWLLLALTVVVVIAVAAAPGRQATVRQPMRVPTVNVPTPVPTTCFAVGAACSLRPCVELVPAPAAVPPPHSLVVPRAGCNRYPHPLGPRVYVRR